MDLAPDREVLPHAAPAEGQPRGRSGRMRDVEAAVLRSVGPDARRATARPVRTGDLPPPAGCGDTTQPSATLSPPRGVVSPHLGRTAWRHLDRCAGTYVGTWKASEAADRLLR